MVGISTPCNTIYNSAGHFLTFSTLFFFFLTLVVSHSFLLHVHPCLYSCGPQYITWILCICLYSQTIIVVTINGPKYIFIFIIVVMVHMANGVHQGTHLPFSFSISFSTFFTLYAFLLLLTLSSPVCTLPIFPLTSLHNMDTFQTFILADHYCGYCQ